MQIDAHDVLLVIDVQNDFCPGGALAVPRGDEVIAPIRRIAPRFEHIILTQDWHPSNHSSFAASHPGKQPYDSIQLAYGPQTLWPPHCVQGTRGAEFHPALQLTQADLILRKGFRPRSIPIQPSSRTTAPRRQAWPTISAIAASRASSSPASLTTTVSATPLSTRVASVSTPSFCAMPAAPSTSTAPSPRWMPNSPKPASKSSTPASFRHEPARSTIASGRSSRQRSSARMSRNFYILAATLGLFALISGA
jgi:hypothetical protein